MRNLIIILENSFKFLFLDTISASTIEGKDVNKAYQSCIPISF